MLASKLGIFLLFCLEIRLHLLICPLDCKTHIYELLVMSSALLPETMQAVYAHVVSDKIDYDNNQRPAIRCNKCGHQFSNASFVPILDQTSLQSAQLPAIPNAWLSNRLQERKHHLHRWTRRPERMLLQAHRVNDVREHLRRQFASPFASHGVLTHNSTQAQGPKFSSNNASEPLSPAILHDTGTLLIIVCTAVICTIIFMICLVSCSSRIRKYYLRKEQKPLQYVVFGS